MLKKINLQFFGEGGTGAADPGSADPGTGAADPNTNGGAGNTNGQKTFTQDEVSAFVSRESKKALEKALKDLGVTDFKTAKEGLAKLKEMQDSTKSETEKQNERIAQLEKDLNEKNNLIRESQLESKLLAANVKPEKLKAAKSIVPTYTDLESDDDKVAKFVEEYPELLNTTQQVKINIGGTRTGGASGATETDVDKKLEARYKAMQY